MEIDESEYVPFEQVLDHWKNYKRTLWDKIYYGFWKRHIVTFVRYDFIRGIKNLWKWFPIVWYDRDWDYGYMEDLLLFKLKRMQNRFEEIRHMDKTSDLKRIKIAILLLKRIREDNLWESPEITRQHELYRKGKISKETRNKFADNYYKQDRNMFYSILAKYSARWWD